MCVTLTKVKTQEVEVVALGKVMQFCSLVVEVVEHIFYHLHLVYNYS